MKFDFREVWIRIELMFILSVFPVIIWENCNATTVNLKIQHIDSTTVYYSYYSGELEQPIIVFPDQDTAIRRPDIIIIGEVLDSEKFSYTTTDTIDDNWFKQTNCQSYTYVVKVNSVEYGSCSKSYLEITVKSSSSYEFGFSHISEDGDSVNKGIIDISPGCGHVVNKQIPVGENCIFHFKKGDLSAVDYISSYCREELKNYMIRSGLGTEN